MHGRENLVSVESNVKLFFVFEKPVHLEKAVVLGRGLVFGLFFRFCEAL